MRDAPDITPASDGFVRFRTPTGRWVLLAAVLGSAVAALDATVVNVALPTIGEELDADFSGLQWTLNAYLLTLSALILLGGALGDRYGRRRVFVIGTIWFALASLLCGLAPTLPVLVAARALQGIGGALLMPASLAIIQASFHPEDRGRAIGAWSGLGGVATAIGPFLGGWLVDAASWRVLFLLNLPLAVVVVVVAIRHVPETTDSTVTGRLDVPGAVAGAVGLAGVTYALIEGPERGFASTLVLIAAILGVLGLAAFLVLERREARPMLPLDIFASRQFTGANLVTFVVYGALGVSFFLLVVQLQQSLAYTPLQAGAASFPITLLMLLLSSRAGQLAQRIGPRLPMTLGPVLIAVAFLLMTRIEPGSSYLTDVLPAVLVFGLGLSLTVAPLTATVLAAADERHAGIASGVNNAVARVAGLVAISALPPLAGITGADYLNPSAFSAGFRTAMLIAAGLSIAGAAVAFATIRNPRAAIHRVTEMHCSVGAPPLRPAGHHVARAG